MLELNLVDDADKAAEKKRQQLLALEFGNIKITKYPPVCKTPEQRQQFDADILAAAQSASDIIGMTVPVGRIRRAICAYACRAFALKEVMPAANELAAKLQAVIKAYEKKNDGVIGGLLEQMAGASAPLNEALERLELAAINNGRGRPTNMSMALFVADMVRLYSDLTGKKAGINKNRGRSEDCGKTYTGAPFAQFSYAAYKLALTKAGETPAESSASWSETVADYLPHARNYLQVLDTQLAEYDEMAETAHLELPEPEPDQGNK